MKAQPVITTNPTGNRVTHKQGIAFHATYYEPVLHGLEPSRPAVQRMFGIIACAQRERGAVVVKPQVARL